MAMSEVFVTVGTTSFDALAESITSDEVLKVLKERGCKHLVLQIGRGDFIPQPTTDGGLHIEYYRFKDDISDDIQNADLVVSHAGAGSCLEALERKKKLLVVVNEKLMHNHQFELAKKLNQEGYLYYTTCGELRETLRTVDLSALKEYPKSDTKVFTDFIDSVMGFA